MGARPTTRTSLRVLAVSGLTVCGLALASAIRSWMTAGAPEAWVLPVAAGLMIVLARSPLVMSGRRAEVVILLDTALYTSVATLARPDVALLAVAAGMVVSCWSLPMTTWVRLAHAGNATAFWALLVGSRALLPEFSSTVTLALEALVVGILGEVGTLAIVAITARCDSGRSIRQVFGESLRSELVAGAGQGGLACFVVTALSAAPRSVPFLGAPLLMIMVVSRALVRAQKANIRSLHLSEGVLAVSRSSDAEAMRAAACHFASTMLRATRAELSAREASDDEIGAAISHPRRGRLHLIVHPRGTGERFAPEDQQALDALASALANSTRNVELIDAMTWQAAHDPLTLLPNRVYFQEVATRALEESKSGGVAVSFVDLDGFKQVNDTLGHDAGDELLVEVARRMSECLRTSDVVARMGGDEFCLLLRDVEAWADVHVVIDQIVECLGTPLRIGMTDIRPRASIGTARAPEDGHDLRTLLRVADERMYARKTVTKNRRSERSA